MAGEWVIPSACLVSALPMVGALWWLLARACKDPHTSRPLPWAHPHASVPHVLAPVFLTESPPQSCSLAPAEPLTSCSAFGHCPRVHEAIMPGGLPTTVVLSLEMYLLHPWLQSQSSEQLTPPGILSKKGFVAKKI